MREIQKFRTPKLVLGPVEDEWQILQDDRQVQVAKAITNPIRRWIYGELDRGPIRQVELTKRASKSFGKRVTNALIRHHLQQLEQMGLVRFEVGPSKAKMVYRTADIRVQIRPRMGAEISGGGPFQTADEFTTELKRIFQKRSPTQTELNKGT